MIFGLCNQMAILEVCINNIGQYKGLVTNYVEGGGATKQEGGHVKFYP